MKRHWKKCAGLTLLVLTVLALLALPATHWRLLGWVRGEAFFRGRPTSYWEREVARLEPSCGGFRYDVRPCPTYDQRSLQANDWLPALKNWFGLGFQRGTDDLPGWQVLWGTAPSEWQPLPVWSRMVDSLPVKRELLKSEVAFVRGITIRFLPSWEQHDLLNLIEAALDDSDLNVRLEAAFCLMEADWLNSRPVEMAGGATVPVFTQGLRHDDEAVRQQCAEMLLKKLPTVAKPAVPALLEALARSRIADRPSSRGWIAAALREIDPEAAAQAGAVFE